ncbi:hypothetical protein CN553_30845 [Bacillus cereus]|uniref:Uncharacterized protein n=1 Tax=Bacillus cereus TaxID=1396 RepID=A0A9X6YJ36_BACCE|nr:hypothetical protein CN553_30845 [Bacillus cereus]
MPSDHEQKLLKFQLFRSSISYLFLGHTLETLHSHCAGLDVYQKEIVVYIFIGIFETELTKEIRTFPTLIKYLFEMLQWLEELHIIHLAMERTRI